MTGGQWAQLREKHGCYYQTMSDTCRLTGKSCPKWHKDEDCDDYIHHAEAVKKSRVHPKLRALIEEAAGNMLFVENGDPRFTDKDLREMMDCIVLQEPNLGKFVSIDASGNGEAAIIIYSGIKAILVDK